MGSLRDFKKFSRVNILLKKEIGAFLSLQKFLEAKSLKYKKWHQIPHISKLHFAVLLLIIVPVWVFSPYLKQDLKTNAGQEDINKKKKIASNKVIIKIKKESKKKLKDPKAEKIKPSDTGLKSIDTLNNKFSVKEVKKIAKEGKKSKTDSPVFDYYSLELPYEERVLTEGLNNKEKKFDRNGFMVSESTLNRVISEYKEDPNIEIAEPVLVLESQLTPSDPRYNELWGMQKIQAPQAWDITTGSSNVIVSVIDTGIDFNHEDLQGNIWTNVGETGGGKETNGIDDDANGYIDDWRGYDFATYGKSRDNDPTDGHGHGTHVSGTIAAVANNGVGVAGVTWNTKIMALKGLSDSGTGYTEDLAEAIVYAADNGARVLNNSWGGYGTSVMLEDVINYAHDSQNVVVVVAAGNDSEDAQNHTPANIANAITVSATGSDDTIAYFSNYGEKIDVAAPGVSILSSTPNNTYSSWSGTSMATPHVAGAAALILSKFSALSPEQVRQALHTSADDIGAQGKDIYYGYGRTNVNKLIQLSAIPNVNISSPISNQTVFGSFNITGSAYGDTFKNFHLEYKKTSDSAWTLINTSTSPTNEGTLGSLDTTPVSFSEGQYQIKLTVTDLTNNIYAVQKEVLVDNISTTISSPTEGQTTPTYKNTVDIIGSADVNTNIFDHYLIEVGKGVNPTAWTTDGITLSDNGLIPTTGPLGTWNIQNLTHDTYKIRLTVWDKSGKSDTHTVATFVDNQLVQEWENMTSNVGMGVTTFDVDGDGKKEIAFSEGANNEESSSIFIYKSDGTLYPGWPKTLDIYTDFPGAGAVQIEIPPTLADLNNDGSVEVIVPVSAASYIGNTIKPKLYVFDINGNLLPGWPKTFNEWSLRSHPAVEDINNDGIKEIAVRTEENLDDNKTRLYVFKPDGTELAGWPQVLGTITLIEGGITSSSPVFYDTNNDGQKEIFVGDYDGNVYGFKNDGTKLPGWPQGFSQSSWWGEPITIKGSVRNTPAIADINNDGKAEVVATIESVNEYYCFVYAWDMNGNILSGWPKYIGGVGSLGSNLLADIDKDGDKEVVSSMGANIYAWHHNGQNVNGWSRLFTNYYSSPATGDINNDGVLETVLAVYHNDNHKIIALSKDSDVVWERAIGCSYPRGCYWQDPVITDIDNDGKIEIIGKNALISGLGVWEIGETRLDTNPWPKFNGNTSNTSAYNFIDFEDPLINISSPSNGATVSGVVPIMAVASDNLGISKVEYYIDNELKHTQSSPNDGPNFKYSWDSVAINNGNYTMKAKAYDISGRFSETHSTVTVKNTISKPGAFSGSTWFLKNRLTQGIADNTFGYGFPASSLMCAWDSNKPGVKLPVIFSNGTWFMRGSLTGGQADNTFGYGPMNAKPVCGDWNGDGVETIGVVDDASNWYLRNSNNSGQADLYFQYGPYWSKPVVGDWDGDGDDTVGVVISGSGWSLRNENNSGPEQVAFYYGFPSRPVSGDWDGDGADTPGIVVGTTWFLRNNNSTGVANISFAYGFPGVQPVVW